MNLGLFFIVFVYLEFGFVYWFVEFEFEVFIWVEMKFNYLVVVVGCIMFKKLVCLLMRCNIGGWNWVWKNLIGFFGFVWVV